MNDTSRLDDIMAALLDIFPDVSEENLLDVALKAGSLEASLDLIINDNVLLINEQINKTTQMELEYLFPSVEKNIISNICCAFSSSPLEELIDTIISQLSSKKRPKYKKLSYSEDIKSEELAPLCSSFKAVLGMSSNSSNFARPVDDDTKRHVHHFSYHFGLADEDVENISSQNPNYYRGEAQELLEHRATLFSKAAESFQRGGLTGTSYASYLSSKGHRISEAINYNNSAAAYISFMKNNPNIETSSQIDLHGLTVKEAEAVTSAFLRHHLIEKESSHVRIITGHGQRSTNGARLRPAVYNLLKSSNYSFTFDNFAVFSVFRD